MKTEVKLPAPDNPDIWGFHDTPSQWIATARRLQFGFADAGIPPMIGKLTAPPTAHPSFLLIGLFGGPKLSPLKL
jgi:hypothetical protein